jgi:cyclohexyl-isocyanide hydratase
MRQGVYLAALRRLGSQARYVTSVCTGSLLLGTAGLLRASALSARLSAP